MDDEYEYLPKKYEYAPNKIASKETPIQSPFSADKYKDYDSVDKCKDYISVDKYMVYNDEMEEKIIE